MAGEEALYEQLRAVLAAAQKDPRLMQALRDTAVSAEKELMQPLFEFRNYGGPLPGKWTPVPNGGYFGTDYSARGHRQITNL